MASQPIKRQSAKRGVYYQVRWQHAGAWHDLTEIAYEDALAASVWLGKRGNAYRKTDPEIVGRAWLKGDSPAIEAVRQAGRRTFGSVVEEWFTTKTVAPKTESGNRSALKHFSAWDERPIDTINHHTLNARYKELITDVNQWTGKPLQKSTAESIMATVCEVLNYAFGEDYTPFSARGARAAKNKLAFKAPSLNKSAARNSFTKAQMLALLAAMPSAQDRLILRFMPATGGRIGEVMALNVEDINLADGLVTFGHHMVGTKRVVGTKGSRGGEVGPAYDVVLDSQLVLLLTEFVHGRAPGEPLWRRPVGERGRRWVSPYLPADAWRTKVFAVAVARLQETGVLSRKATPHWTRHTTGSWGRTKLSSRLLSDHMRHEDPRTTTLYEHKSEESIAVIRAALDELFDDVA